MNDTQRFTLFRKDLLRWFAENRRPLPWRADYTPYRTWIAEVMMQQTRLFISFIFDSSLYNRSENGYYSVAKERVVVVLCLTKTPQPSSV